MNKLFTAVLGSTILMGPLLLVARIFTAVVFLVYGVNKLIHTPQMQDYMQSHNGAVPVRLIYLAIVVQIGCGALVVAGYQTRFAALMLAGFCIIATVLFHSNFSEAGEMTHFLKDFSIAGGFLFMFAYGPGPLSLDAYLERARSKVASEASARIHAARGG
jgi:putative oxidoreductase